MLRIYFADLCALFDAAGFMFGRITQEFMIGLQKYLSLCLQHAGIQN